MASLHGAVERALDGLLLMEQLFLAIRVSVGRRRSADRFQFGFNAVPEGFERGAVRRGGLHGYHSTRICPNLRAPGPALKPSSRSGSARFPCPRAARETTLKCQSNPA